MKKINVFFEAVLLILILQVIREVLEIAFSSYANDDAFLERMLAMCVMTLLTFVFILYVRLRKVKFSVFPAHFGKSYIFLTVIYAVLLISAPSNYTGGYKPILLLLYGSIVTPIYEELIFRGYIWNRISSVQDKPFFTCLCSVALFALWHLGYMVPHIIDGNFVAVLWKLAAGFGYGVVLGLLRLKTGNCYSTMLLHGMLNLFMV